MNIKRKLKRLAAAFLAVAGTLAPLGVWADTWTDTSGNVWTYSGGTVSAVSFETTNLTIPDTLGGNPVTAFTAGTFKGKIRAVRVTIPATVTTIPAEAFLNCENLKSVTIQGEGLTSIGARAFKGCGNLESFVMPNSVTSLGQGVFSGCSSMELVTLSDGLTALPGVVYGSQYDGKYNDSSSDTSLKGSYGNGLFYNCTSLKTINWGNGIKTIGNIAFLNCTALESVTIPNSVTSIGHHAFLGCANLGNVKIGDGVTTIERMAFRALPNLTKVTFGAKVKEIQQQAFQDCVNLQNFTLPDTIQYLRYRCFAGCNKALTDVTIPTNVDEQDTELSQGVFSGCSKLATVTFGDTVKVLTGVEYGSQYDGKYNDNSSDTSLKGSYGNGLFYNCTSLKTINWGNGIKTIGNIAFLNCTALESVTIPNTVTSIGCHAFHGCSGLVSLNIGDGVTAIERGAFRALPNLTNVTIGSNVKKIGVQAFLNCVNLSRVQFGPKVNVIQDQAFQGCVNLQNFTLPDTIQYLRYRCFAGCNKALTEVTIPANSEGLDTELGQGVFSGCSKLATVTFGDTVKVLTGVEYGSQYDGKYNDNSSDTSLKGSYGNGLFYNCTSLKTINWGNGIKTIGNIAFLNCTALESVTIPNSVTSIGQHAFLGCVNLGNVKIGDGVTVVERMAFRALPNLTKVTFGAKVKEIQQQAFQDCVNLQNFTLPDTIQYFRYRCFAGCNKALTEVTIPSNREGMDTEFSQGVFSGCSKLATVTFGDTVKVLTGVVYGSQYDGKYNDSSSDTSLKGSYGNGLFYNCTSLKTINWGNGIKTIGNIAFLNCTALESVTIPNSVTSIGHHAFLGCANLGNVKIGDGVTTIERMAFRALPNLTKVTFGAKVKEIQQQAFQDCVNLQNFTLPDTIQYFRYRCFAGCNKALTEVTIPTNRDGLDTEFSQGVFSGCSKLATVTFGDTVKTLTGVGYGSQYDGKYNDSSSDTSLKGSYGNGLFYNCTSLKTINWGNGVKTIGNVAFLNCSSLTDLVLPANITDIGNHAFFGCSSLNTVTVMGNVNSIGRYAFGNCNALHYVDFRGATMAFAPGYMPFKFDRDVMTVYAAEGSTGWTGVAGVGGLPESGKWCGARITYAPPSENAGNPYDFYVYSSKATISKADYYWSLMMTTNRYVHGKTVPRSIATIREGDPVYLSYAFDEYWRGEAFDVTNRFTLSGAKEGTFDLSSSWEAHSTVSYGWKTNATPELLQNLEPGEYTLTLQLNGDNRLKETDYANNTTSITFTVVGTPRYTVTFDLNGASGTAPDARTVYEGKTVGELPEVTAPAGWTFLGWYTAATDGTKVTASTKVTADTTLYAHWSKCDLGFYSDADQEWEQNLFVTSVSSGNSHMSSFKQGDRIYLKYGFKNIAGDFDVTGFVNRFALNTGTTFDKDWSSSTLQAGKWGWGGSAWYPDELQNLAPGTYTLTCTLDADADVLETDEGNNTKSITFTVVASGQQPGPDPLKNYTVTFNANGGSVSPATRTVASGSTVGTLPAATRSGYTFDGWFTSMNGGTKVTSSTKVTANVTYYAHWAPVGPLPPDEERKDGDTMPVVVIINNITVNVTVIVGDVWGTSLPTPSVRPGWTFVGWYTGENGTGSLVTASTKVTGVMHRLYAYYVRNEDVVSYYLYSSVLGTVPKAAAAVYDGYLYRSGTIAGTIQVKVGKPNAKTGLAAVKATVIGLDGKKKTLKASGNGKVQISAAGPTTVTLTGGDACEVILGAKGMSGTYGGYGVDGALNVFTSKDAADKAVATAVLGRWQGAVNVAWQGAQGWNGLSVAIAAKGKAKVAGTLADGTKVSAKGQLIVGDAWCCVPVLYAKRGATLAFALWLPLDAAGRVSPAAVGLADAVVGRPGTLKGGAAFRLGAALGDAKYGAYLPDGLAVGGGAKWTLPKAGKVQLTRDGTVDAAKLGDNPSALKLTYKAKDGSFKGSFKAYSDVNGKPKATTVKVTGVLVNGVGYGSATIKNVGGASVTIE